MSFGGLIGDSGFLLFPLKIGLYRCWNRSVPLSVQVSQYIYTVVFSVSLLFRANRQMPDVGTDYEKYLSVPF